MSKNVRFSPFFNTSDFVFGSVKKYKTTKDNTFYKIHKNKRSNIMFIKNTI